MRQAVENREHTLAARAWAEERRPATTEFGDRLRETADAGAMAYVAAEILGRTLNGTPAGYGAVDLRPEIIVIEQDWRHPAGASISGPHRFGD